MFRLCNICIFSREFKKRPGKSLSPSRAGKIRAQSKGRGSARKINEVHGRAYLSNGK